MVHDGGMRSSERAPDRVAHRIAHRIDGAEGYRYGELPADVGEALPRWLAEGCVEEGVEAAVGFADVGDV